MTETNRPTSVTPRTVFIFFLLFLLLHTVLWTIGPWLTRSSLPHDTLESITWGMQWQWGYNKHPFMAAWLSAGISKLFNAVEWPAYLLAQLAVTTTFIATWQLARKLLPPMHAIIAVLALDGVLFYNINSFNLTPDTLQSPLWALLTLFFYQALTTQYIRYWLATGLMVALCVMTKYQAMMLLIPMFLLCLINKQARASWLNPGLYIAVGIILLLMLPHLTWLWQHDFVTIQYALGAPYDHTHLHAHFACLLRYLSNGVAYTSGLFLLLWPFYRSIKRRPIVTAFDWQFLLFTGIGPCLLTALFCFINGDNIPVRWSTPYFFLLGIIMMACLKPKISPRQLKQFLVTVVLFSGTLWGARMVTTIAHLHMNSDAYLPNKAIATQLTKLWKQHYSTPLYYLGGAHYLVGATVPYFVDKPIPYFSFDPKENPWLNENDFIKHGGLFVWDAGVNYFWDAYSPKMERLPNQIKQRYPNLIVLGTYTFYRVTPTLMPVTIGVALIPPLLEFR